RGSRRRAVPLRRRGSPRSAGAIPRRSPRSLGTAQVRRGTHLMLPAPPEHAHLFFVVGHRDTPHAAGDVVPFDAAAGEALLAGFQRLQVVGGGEATWAEESQEAVEPTMTEGGRLVGGRQCPRGD